MKVKIFKVRILLTEIRILRKFACLIAVSNYRNMFELIRIESLLTGIILDKKSYKHFRSKNVGFNLSKCIILNRPYVRAV